MIINPIELLGEIKLLLKRNDDYTIHSISFPAIDIKDSDHDLFEFSSDKLESWNKKFAYPNELAVDFRKIASIEIKAADKNINQRLKSTNIFNLNATKDRNGNPISYNAKFELGLYEFIIDSNQMYDEDYNVNKLMSEIRNFISVIIISSIQIGAVLTKYNINPNFYSDFFENDDNPIFSSFQKFFGEEFIDSLPNEEEFKEFSYLDITDIINYIFDIQISKDSKGSFLLAYFPLYVANFNNDIITEEELGISLKPKKCENIFSTIDLVNFIMENQEG